MKRKRKYSLLDCMREIEKATAVATAEDHIVKAIDHIAKACQDTITLDQFMILCVEYKDSQEDKAECVQEIKEWCNRVSEQFDGPISISQLKEIAK